MVSRLPAAARRFLRRVRSDTSGLSTVEFGLVLPVMLFIYIGMVESAAALNVARKVDRVAGTVGDLVAQAPSGLISLGEMENIFNASTAILEPTGTGLLTMVVAAVDYVEMTAAAAQQQGFTGWPSGGSNVVVPIVSWSTARNTTPYPAGAMPPIGLSGNIADAGQQVIISVVRYEFSTPFTRFASAMTGRDTWQIDDIYYLRPRQADTIALGG